ncbi:MAG: SAM-dependent methyltransferase [Rhodobacteraceae bacterium]|nr:SAM-dependent methyltransferase [Paracoccaceae bacterium]
MTPLAGILARRIRAEGPITVADYMAECLLHPEHGYYATRDPLGADGDFTTAPEISQMFGECLGLALVQAWLDQGRPPQVVLAEIGPGRGTLMADMLRATRAVPGFAEAMGVHLVEASPVLREKQRQALPDVEVTWHDRVETLPEAPLFLVANEFFDALPIRQFIRDPGGWRERRVALEGEALVFGATDPAPLADLAHRLEDTGPGDMVEICPSLPPIAGEVARRVGIHGGVAIFVDYGDWRSKGDTLQALKAHEYCDVLAEPGLADLTAHVDFEALAKAAAPHAAVTRMTPQGVLLERLGITARAQVLARGLSGAALESHIAAHRRLTHPEEMGSLFKSIAYHPKGTPPPPGFD